MTMRGMLGAFVLCVAACSQAPAPVTFHADGYPEKLGDWNVVYRDGDALALNDRVVPFDLNTPLFSDYAHKLRTVWMPEGAHARSEEHTSELQSLMRISYAVFCLKKKKKKTRTIEQKNDKYKHMRMLRDKTY